MKHNKVVLSDVKNIVSEVQKEPEDLQAQLEKRREKQRLNQKKYRENTKPILHISKLHNLSDRVKYITKISHPEILEVLDDDALDKFVDLYMNSIRDHTGLEV